MQNVTKQISVFFNTTEGPVQYGIIDLFLTQEQTVSISNLELLISFLPKNQLCLSTGLFSVIMRDLANMTTDGPKWIVLDGDIDPMWIESLNTVMDDNKVLTLASNERIPLTPSMRLLFEISHLRTATPATVSRAGILFINTTDLGWNP